MSRAHHKLEAWRRAIELVKSVYDCSASFPPEELYGLTNQMRRAAVSVPANIAEAVGRAAPNDRARFFIIARGSLSELDTYVVLARELGYLRDTVQLESDIGDVFGLLIGLMTADKKRAS